MHEGLSASRTDARTSFTRSPSVAFSLSSSGFSSFRLIRLGLVLQVFAGRSLVDRLQIDLAILLDAGEDDLVDLVVENQDLEILLLVDFEQRRSAQQRLRRRP